MRDGYSIYIMYISVNPPPMNIYIFLTFSFDTKDKNPRLQKNWNEDFYMQFCIFQICFVVYPKIAPRPR